MSVVLESVPVEVPAPKVKATVRPPLVSAFPAASRAVSVTATALPEATVGAATATADCASESAPTVTVSVGSTEVSD